MDKAMIINSGGIAEQWKKRSLTACHFHLLTYSACDLQQDWVGIFWLLGDVCIHTQEHIYSAIDKVDDHLQQDWHRYILSSL